MADFTAAARLREQAEYGSISLISEIQLREIQDMSLPHLTRRCTLASLLKRLRRMSSQDSRLRIAADLRYDRYADRKCKASPPAWWR